MSTGDLKWLREYWEGSIAGSQDGDGHCIEKWRF